MITCEHCGKDVTNEPYARLAFKFLNGETTLDLCRKCEIKFLKEIIRSKKQHVTPMISLEAIAHWFNHENEIIKFEHK